MDFNMDFITDVKSEESRTPTEFPLAKNETVEEDSWNLIISGIKEEYTDYTRDFVPDAKIVENPISISFPLLNNEPVDQLLDVVTVKEKVSSNEPSGSEVADESMTFIDLDGMTSTETWDGCGDIWSNNKSIGLPVEDIHASSFDVHTANLERLCGQGLDPSTEDFYRENSSSGNSDGYMPESMFVQRLDCKFCSECFPNSDALKQHLREHKGEKSFQCQLCGNSFNHSGNLKQHLRTHTGVKPFKCHVCGKGFTRSSNRNTHVRIHTGAKPFKCEVCGKDFARSSSLKDHLRVHIFNKLLK